MTDAASFRRSLTATITLLAIVVAGLAAVNYLQGPRLSSALVDAAGVVKQGGQQLRLFLNEPVARVRAAQVSVVPAAPFTVSTSGGLVAVQFTRALNYDTDYRVSIAGVTSLYQDRPASVSYRFHTASPAIYYLNRGQGTDEVVKTGVRSTDRSVVFSAPRIQSFAVFDALVAVVTADPAGVSSLTLVSSNGLAEHVALPGDGTVDNLGASPDTGYFGFTFTSNDGRYDSTLFGVDLGATRLLKPVPGVAGKPMQVLDWSFLPHSSQAVVLTADDSLLHLDFARPATVSPLGSFSSLGHVSSDGSTVTVGTASGMGVPEQSVVTIATGAAHVVTPLPLDGVKPFGADLQLLAGGARVQVVSVYSSARNGYVDRLVLDTGGRSKELYRTVKDAGRIDAMSVSPNDQYAAIEVTPNLATATPDGYHVDGRSTSETTYIVDLATGAVVRGVTGFHLQW